MEKVWKDRWGQIEKGFMRSQGIWTWSCGQWLFKHEEVWTDTSVQQFFWFWLWHLCEETLKHGEVIVTGEEIETKATGMEWEGDGGKIGDKCCLTMQRSWLMGLCSVLLRLLPWYKIVSSWWTFTSLSSNSAVKHLVCFFSPWDRWMVGTFNLRVSHY